MTDILEVELIDLFPLENSKHHHTERFELVHAEPPTPVLRRGSPFTIALQFANRNFDSTCDNVKLIFSFGSEPIVFKGTKAVLKVSDKATADINPNFWTCKLLKNTNKTLTLEVQTSVLVPVGIWSLNVETNSNKSATKPQNFIYEEDVFILFNPWNKNDSVFMPDERFLDEYVLTDVGKIWVGPWGSSRGREWIFGQFDKSVLLSTMLMFERSGLSWASRGDPVKVSRTISKLVNSNDDDGILMGRWDGDYDDGTAPAAWTGSIAILEEFLESERPVKYGQCWVFAGIVTSICRALGIPSRVVSNLVSAHDANGTLSIDRYYNAKDEELSFDPLNEFGEDSIWNYHVWNDVWMARPDLPKGYGGWQAIDATPQEKSNGFFQCGPASLEAIKQGYVGYTYDVAFMLASVNADLMRWKEDSTCEMGYSKIYCNTYHIGKMILTKQPFIFDPNGDKDRENITLQYKAKEGSEAERLALMNGVRGTQLAKSFYQFPDADKEDMEFTLQDLERVNIGDSFDVIVNIKNKSDKIRKVKASLSAGSIFYTGVKANTVKRASGQFTIRPKSSEQLRMTVTAAEYLDKLVEYCIMKLYAVATVEETNQTWADEDDFQVLKPSISFEVPNELVVNEPGLIKLNFKNPIKTTLTNCKFNVAGPGLTRNQIIPYRDIEPEEAVVVREKLFPQLSGEQTLIATFTSKELLDITGSTKIVVKK